MKPNDHRDSRTLAANRVAGTSAIRRAYQHLGQGRHLEQPRDRVTRAGLPPVDPRHGAIGPDLLAMTVNVFRQHGYARRADGHPIRAVS